MAGPDGYAGDITSEEAWRILKEDPDACLVDVRTRAEWTFVGIPDLSGVRRGPVLIEWQSFPDMAVDPAFGERLDALLEREGVPPGAPLLFLCRSGARSASAAALATARGHARAFNVADGFEGPPDGEGHRGTVAGWKASGLPWRQG